MNLSAEFITALDVWVNAGTRSVKIEWGTLDPACHTKKIWCYDYDLGQGEFVDSIEEIPTTEQLEKLNQLELKEKLKKLKHEVEKVNGDLSKRD